MSSRTIILSLCVIALATFTSRSFAQDADKLNPQLRLAQGMKWEFESSVSQSNKMQMVSQGNTVPQGEQGMQMHRKGTLEVLAAKEGMPTSIRVTYDPSCTASASQNGQTMEQPFPLAGKSVTVKKDEMGIISIDGAATDAQTTSELQEMISPDRSLFPKNPVGVGDEWQGDTAAMSKQFSLGPNDSAQIQCKFVKLDMVHERKTADIAITAQINKAQDPVNIKVTLSGMAYVDLTTGYTLRADVDGAIISTGQTQTPQGQMVDIRGNGTMQIHETQKLLNGGNAVATVAEPATPSPVAAPQSSLFAGVFHGQSLSCEFADAGAGNLKGTITLGAQKFPATATESAGTLTGAFTAGGTSFPFTARLADNQLTLASGGRDYVMTKEAVNPLAAPANPLGGGNEPPNPLAH